MNYSKLLYSFEVITGIIASVGVFLLISYGFIEAISDITGVSGISLRVELEKVIAIKTGAFFLGAIFLRLGRLIRLLEEKKNPNP